MTSGASAPLVLIYYCSIWGKEVYMEKLIYNFKGYFDIEDGSLPKTSWIYVLYEYAPESGRGFNLQQIVYVGQTKDFSSRVPEHIGEWNLAPGSKLYVTYAEFDEDYLDWAEAALVFALKPPFNEYLKDKYQYQDTRLIITGAMQLMKHEYIVISGKKKWPCVIYEKESIWRRKNCAD